MILEMSKQKGIAYNILPLGNYQSIEVNVSRNQFETNFFAKFHLKQCVVKSQLKYQLTLFQRHLKRYNISLFYSVTMSWSLKAEFIIVSHVSLYKNVVLTASF